MMLRHVLNGLAKRTQHIATGWPNVRNMLCPTMLQDVALKCSERLARPLNSPMSEREIREREIREYSPVVHSDDTVFRFDFTLTEHQQLERIYHGHLFARNSARANLQQTKKTTTQICEKRSWSCLATRRLDHSGWPCMDIISRLV